MSEVRACARCRFALRFVAKGQIQSQLQCRWGPPAMIAIPVRATHPGQVSMQMIPFARPVPEVYWCHQFIPLPEGESVPTESENVQNVAEPVKLP